MNTQDNNSVLLKFLLHLHPPRIPKSSARFTYTYGLGGLTIFSFLVTVVTGLVLLFHYSPTPAAAYTSMQQITTIVPYGWYIRNLHFWAAQLLVIAAVLHLIRIVLSGGYLRGRAFNYVVGIVLLFLIFLVDFTGFPLRWDAESHWALIVGTNLVKAIPIIGNSLHQFVVGGANISNVTLLRFYGWHIFGLPFMMTLLIGYHFYRIRKDGGISRDASVRHSDTISREQLLVKEGQFLLIIIILLTGFSALVTPHLGKSAEINPILSDVQAPWIFLGIQFLLRYLPPEIAGIGIPSLMILFWITLPYIDSNDEVQAIYFSSKRRIFWLSFLCSVGVIAGTMIIESLT